MKPADHNDVVLYVPTTRGDAAASDMLLNVTLDANADRTALAITSPHSVAIL